MKKRIFSLALIFALLFTLYGGESLQVKAATEAKYIYDAAVLADGTIAALYIAEGTVYYGSYNPVTSAWHKTEVAAGKDCALYVDANDVPHIAYITADDNLGYTCADGSGWTAPEIIDSVAFGGVDGALTSPDIVVDGNGGIHLTYFDAKGGYTGGNDYNSYDTADLMYATNASGSFVKSVRSYSHGWLYSPDGWRNQALAPAKITYTGGDYWIGLLEYSFDKWMSGQYHTYTYNILTTPATPSHDLSLEINSSSKSNSRGFKLFDMDSDGSNPYSLWQKDGSLYVTNGITEITAATKTAAVGGAALTVNGSGSIHYAAINGSSLLLYQNGAFKEALPLSASLSSHTRIATVCDSATQYTLYTDTGGVLQIAKVSLTPGDNDVETFAVPDLIPVTISGVTVGSKTYDGTAAAYAGSPGAVETVSGNAASVSAYDYSWYDVTNAASLSAAPSAAGSYKLTVSVAESDGTYSGSTEIPFTIAPATLSVSGVKATNRAYNGGDTVAITGGTLNGVFDGDDVSPVVPATGIMLTTTVGNNKVVTITAVTLSGDAAANYTLTQPTGLTVDIAAAELTISSVKATNRGYNGSDTVAITGGTLNGIFDGDDVSPIVPATGSMASATVGNDKDVTIDAVTLSGDHAANYVLTQPTGLTVDIAAAALTISGVKATNRGYNGSNTVAITGGTLNGVFNGDDVSPIVPATGSMLTATIGNDKDVAIAAVTLSGDAAANYVLTQPTGLTVDIAAAELTIATVTADDKTYDGTTAATVSAVTFNGLQNGETLTFDTDFSVTAAFSDSGAANLKDVSITVALKDTEKAGNYTLPQGSFSDTAAITKAPGLIAATPDPIKVVKDLEKSYRYDLTAIDLNKTDTGDVAYSLNLLSGDALFVTDPEVDGGSLTFTAAAVSAGSATQTLNIHCQNYQDITVDLDFVLVDRKTVTIGGVSVANQTYDGKAVAWTGTPTATETDGGAEASVSSYIYTWYQGTTALTAAPKNAGDYKLHIAVAANDEAYWGETELYFAIGKKDLTVKPLNKTVYTNALLPTPEITYNGLIAGESAANVIVFGEPLVMEIQDGHGAPLVDTAVNGTYPIVFTNRPTYVCDNYTVLWAEGTLTVESEVTVAVETNENTTTVLPRTTVDQGFATAALGAVDAGVILAELSGKDVTKLIIEPKVSGEIGGINTELPKSIAAEMANRQGTLTIVTALGNVELSKAALTTLAQRAGDTLSCSIINNSDNTVTIAIKVGNTLLQNIGGVKVTLPQALAPGEVPVISGSGSPGTIVKKSAATANGFTALLTGSATLEIINNAKDLKDISSGHWAKDAVDFATSHQLFLGTSETKFSPETTMNRGMFVTVLYRLEESPEVEQGVQFTDVASNTWYTKAVYWAAQNNIVMGTGGNRFEPEKSITREEMAVMLYRYCNAMGYDTSVRGNLDGFADGNTVSSWAETAMSYAVGDGLIKGKNHNRIDPRAGATRAEVATILQRFIGVLLT